MALVNKNMRNPQITQITQTTEGSFNSVVK
jgi:hypothetical protein